MNKSFYIVNFCNGTSIHSDNSSWVSYSEKLKVNRRGIKKLVYASSVPIKSIFVHHNGLEKTVEVPEGYRVFQSIIARTTFSNDSTINEVCGRLVGLVKGNEVVEEYNLNGETNEIVGFRN